jgi:hypothetical protein
LKRYDAIVWHDQNLYPLTGRKLEGDRKEVRRRVQGGCKESGMKAEIALLFMGLNF